MAVKKRPGNLLDRRIVNAPDDRAMRHAIDVTLREHRAAILALADTADVTDDDVSTVAAKVASGAAVTDGDKGDITVSGSGLAWAIDAGVVDNAKLAAMTGPSIKGRAAGTGTPGDLTPAQATAILDTFTALLNGLVPASGGGTTNYLRADGSWAPPTSSATISSATVTLPYAKKSHRVTVVDATVTPASKLLISWGSYADTDDNSSDMDGVSFQALPGAGSFTLLVTSSDPVGGAMKINYMVG